MNLREKISRLAHHIFLLTAALDREITEYWRNFFTKEQKR